MIEWLCFVYTITSAMLRVSSTIHIPYTVYPGIKPGPLFPSGSGLYTGPAFIQGRRLLA